jgi:hypothetical protein
MDVKRGQAWDEKTLYEPGNRRTGPTTKITRMLLRADLKPLNNPRQEPRHCPMDGATACERDGISECRDATMAARYSPVRLALRALGRMEPAPKQQSGRGVSPGIPNALTLTPPLGGADAGQTFDFSTKFGRHQGICIIVTQIEAMQLDARVYWYFPHLMQTVAAGFVEEAKKWRATRGGATEIPGTGLRTATVEGGQGTRFRSRSGLSSGPYLDGVRGRIVVKGPLASHARFFGAGEGRKPPRTKDCSLRPPGAPHPR